MSRTLVIPAKQIKVSYCKDCPYFGRSMDGMQCDHPHWEKIKDPYANMIISQDDLKAKRFPEKCPLK